MNLMNWVDWLIIGAYFVITLGIGLSVSRKAGKNAENFFLGGRSQPWWLLGFSMVATTFSTDTPNLVTDIVRTKGVAGNWEWWALLLTGMLTVFIYSKLWRRSGVLTDIEFYEKRYSGKWASFLRGFRAVYLGFIFNILVMATVTLACIKIGQSLLGLDPIHTILIASIVVLLVSAVSGFEGVLFTDFLLFILAMTGAVAAAVYSVKAAGDPAVMGAGNEVAGLAGILKTIQGDPDLSGKLAMIPKGPELISLFLIPLTVQWWASYYPGAEPGGGGYLVQKMLAAKDEKNATGATLFFNVAHYALRPWPWIIVALASMVVFPHVSDIQAQLLKVNPNLDPTQIVAKNDLAYSAMLTFLPHGILGMMVASLLAAYMSTMGTQLNWGSSYMANDVWKRFIRPNAGDKEVVWVGRVSTLILLVLSAVIALYLKNAKQAFDFIVMMGAGTGLVLILRWFWWRINAVCEFVAMMVSFVIAILLKFVLINPAPAFFSGSPAVATLFHQFVSQNSFSYTTQFCSAAPGVPMVNPMYHLLLNVGITTVAWLLVAFFTKPTDQRVLEAFIAKMNPGTLGWKPIFAKAKAEGREIHIDPNAGSVKIGLSLFQMVLACLLVYCFLFATGYFLYGNWALGIGLTVGAVLSGTVLLLTIFGFKCPLKHSKAPTAK